MIGQDEAIEAVANAMRRSRAGLADPNRPLGSFIFLGPTGVGKTELARALAEFLFDSDQAMVRIDMSEYMEKHAVSRLIGAPPGYVGYEEGGQLTEAVRRRPYRVVLFDEIEKAHPDVFNILLAGAGRWPADRRSGPNGRFQEHRHHHDLQPRLELIVGLNLHDKDAMRNRVMEALREHFRPEFLNRIDETVIFEPLSREQIGEIVEIQLERVAERLADRRHHLADHRGCAGMALEPWVRPGVRGATAEAGDSARSASDSLAMNQSELANVNELADQLAAQSGDLSDETRNEIRKLLEAKRDILNQLVNNYTDYSTNLATLHSSESQLIAMTEHYAAFIAERVLWIRSCPPLSRAISLR